MFSFLKRKKKEAPKVVCNHIWESLEDITEQHCNFSDITTYCPKCKTEGKYTLYRFREIQKRQEIDEEYQKYKQYKIDTEDWSDF